MNRLYVLYNIQLSMIVINSLYRRATSKLYEVGASEGTRLGVNKVIH